MYFKYKKKYLEIKVLLDEMDSHNKYKYLDDLKKIKIGEMIVPSLLSTQHAETLDQAWFFVRSKYSLSSIITEGHEQHYKLLLINKYFKQNSDIRQQFVVKYNNWFIGKREELKK